MDPQVDDQFAAEKQPLLTILRIVTSGKLTYLWKITLLKQFKWEIAL